MIKPFIYVIAIASLWLPVNASAQEPGPVPQEMHQMPKIQRPSTFDLADEARNEIGLEHKEFDKVYAAYHKFIKKVFGDDSNTGAPREPMHMGRGHGPGPRPGGGMPPHGMGAPDENFSKRATAPDQKQRPKDIEKLEKTRKSENEKLLKNMKKIFKKNPSKYTQWLGIWEKQQDRLFPQSAPKQNLPK